jgi:cell fate regulator YaaT (PSP1 superfamily)
MERSICSRGVVVKDSEGTESTVCQNSSCSKLSTFDWLGDIPNPPISTDIVEVQFKNTRKGFYKNVNNLLLKKGDVIAVEASPGHDIGAVTLTGWLVYQQLKRVGIDPKTTEFKKVYRKAKPADIDKWLEAISLEQNTMIRTRLIVTELELNMKIGDVEYQGDRTKAVFYYIADERVDFRELIKRLADEFQIRVEMRQIGARQEAGRIGGIGSCGRELCCASWINNFVSVTTNAARVQEISLNPQKLAGQCSKLKCCLNYELDSYQDARKDFPKTTIALETKDATYFHQKTDIFKRIFWYSSEPNSAVNLTAVPVDRAKEIIELNKKGIKPLKLIEHTEVAAKSSELKYSSGFDEDSLTRFDEPKKKSSKKRKKNRRRNNNESQP